MLEWRQKHALGGIAAARQLAAQGFKKAVNLRGGLAAWRAENLPVTKDTK